MAMPKPTKKETAINTSNIFPATNARSAAKNVLKKLFIIYTFTRGIISPYKCMQYIAYYKFKYNFATARKGIIYQFEYTLTMNKDDILSILHGVIHPETSSDIVTSGILRNLIVTGDKIQFTLFMPRPRDPMSASLKKQAEAMITERFPRYRDKITIFIQEPKKQESKPHEADNLAGIKRIIAVSSAKGGVGKSTVTANLAMALARKGKKTGILDTDIYGPSQAMMFGVEDYVPGVENIGGKDMMRPAEAAGVKVMSISFFINPEDPLVWRGPMANNALKQMIHQTLWGDLDYLLLDLPPGTGDIHLSVISELKITGAIIVSTPQKIALADVIRGINMFRSGNINIPILGIVENMSWFSPVESPDKKYYIFGTGGAEDLAGKEGIPLLAQIPLILGNEESTSGKGYVDNYYNALADKILKNE